jgi:hypothetical protein
VADVKMFTKCRWESLKGRDHSGNLDVDGKVILEWILGKEGGGTVFTGFIWFSIETSGGS